MKKEDIKLHNIEYNNSEKRQWLIRGGNRYSILVLGSRTKIFFKSYVVMVLKE